MKVCIIVEGCYPYVMGGVSSWTNNLISRMPETEFLVQSIIVDRSMRGKFRYELPGNVLEVREIYLQDDDWVGLKRPRRLKLKPEEKEALKSLVFSENVDWPGVFEIFKNPHITLNNLLMGKDFLEIVSEYYENSFDRVAFTNFLWTMRSMYLPVCMVLKNRPPEADLYHSVATGYSGLWGSMAKYLHHAPLLISEHGIYTREREEEIIKADWVKGIYKDIWIGQFAKFSHCAYHYADRVTSLFENARQLQTEIGCPPEKTMVTPNGIRPERFENLARKSPEDTYINVGAVLRVTPIKDVKTMIYAFYYAKQSEPRLKLWIMGPLDEQPEYAQECIDLVKALELSDVEFTGPINVTDYLGKMDMFLLTSISEGQPLSILEAFAAKLPCVATNVGNCEGLIHGERDDYGEAGIVAPVMSISKLSDGILTLARDKEMRLRMGQNGYRRAVDFYNDDDCMETYRKLYRELCSGGYSGDNYHTNSRDDTAHTSNIQRINNGTAHTGRHIRRR